MQPDPYHVWTENLNQLLTDVNTAIMNAWAQRVLPLKPLRPNPTSDDEMLPDETPGDRACSVMLELEEALVDALTRSTNDTTALSNMVSLACRQRAGQVNCNE